MNIPKGKTLSILCFILGGIFIFLDYHITDQAAHNGIPFNQVQTLWHGFDVVFYIGLAFIGVGFLVRKQVKRQDKHNQPFSIDK